MKSNVVYRKEEKKEKEFNPNIISRFPEYDKF